jgi:hypothetical protein
MHNLLRMPYLVDGVHTWVYAMFSVYAGSDFQILEEGWQVFCL